MSKSNINDNNQSRTRLSRLTVTKRTLPRDEMVSLNPKIVKTQNFASFESRIDLETSETTPSHSTISKRRLLISLNRLYERVNQTFNSTKSLVLLNDDKCSLSMLKSLRKFHHWSTESVFRLKEQGFEFKSEKKRHKSSFQSKILEMPEYALYVDWLDSSERNHVLSHECIHKFEKQRRLSMLAALERNLNVAKGVLDEKRIECLSLDAISKLHYWAFVSMLKLRRLN